MSIVTFDGRERALHGDIRLDGKDIDLVVGAGLVSFDEELSITTDTSGPSVPIIRIGVFDPDRTLVTSGLLDLHPDDGERLGREVELIVDGVAYWLRSVAKQQDTFTLTFEDRTIAKLRDSSGVLKVNPAVMDDRRFITHLCTRAGVPAPIVAAPGAREQAARAKAGIGKTRLRHDDEQRKRDENREPGLADRARVTIKGHTADAEQVRNLNIGLSEALRCNPTPLGLVTLIAAGIVESEWRNNQGAGADAISFGVMQNIPGTSAGVNGTMTQAQALDVAYSVRSALLPPGPTSAGGLIKVSQQKPDADAGTLADICINGVGVGDPGYVSKVNRYRGEAERIIAAFAGDGSLSGAGRSVEFTREAALRVDRGESDLQACVRTASERNARFFVVANQPYYLYDEALMRSRPRMVLSEDEPGVEWIDWEWAPRKQVRQTDVQARASVWQAPPGSVVLLDDDCGPAAGRWLVGDYKRSRFSPTASITLIKGRKPIVPTERETLTLGTDSLGAAAKSIDTADQAVLAMYAKADAIARKRQGYVWGGGHGRFDDPAGYDCSGVASTVIHAAGGLDSPQTTSGLLTAGVAGEGRYVTWWVRETGDPHASHVFMTFKHTKAGTRYFEAGGGEAITGWHQPRSTDGFAPRHLPGT